MRKRLWIAPLVVGAILPPLYWYFYVRDYVVAKISGDTFYRSDVADMTRAGIDADAYLFVGKLGEKARDKRQPLTTAEWERLASLASQSDWNTRLLALGVLRANGRLDRGPQTADVLKGILYSPNEPDAMKRAYLKEAALSGLRGINADGWRAEAEKFVADPDIARDAQGLLK